MTTFWVVLMIWLGPVILVGAYLLWSVMRLPLGNAEVQPVAATSTDQAEFEAPVSSEQHQAHEAPFQVPDVSELSDNPDETPALIQLARR